MRKALTAGLSALALLTLGSGVATAAGNPTWTVPAFENVTGGGTYWLTTEQNPDATPGVKETVLHLRGSLVSTAGSGCRFLFMQNRFIVQDVRPAQAMSPQICGSATHTVTIDHWIFADGIMPITVQICDGDVYHCGAASQLAY
ncbi:hypothetical protein [Kutzneria sp. NPDC051319]|uniref:hypothetical protein n=1 Tax=Kutzneria sp. NPDC051319 TaxID=3155047 RepID=UPI0034123946